MRPIRPHETKALRRAIERRHKEYLWGQPHMITPRLVDEVFGDGRKLMALTPLNARPNYYVVRVDSLWDMSNYAEGDAFCDHLDDIYEAIEGQFGVCRCDEDGYQCRCRFPVADLDTGTSWDELKWPRVQKRKLA